MINQNLLMWDTKWLSGWYPLFSAYFLIISNLWFWETQWVHRNVRQGTNTQIFSHRDLTDKMWMQEKNNLHFYLWKPKVSLQIKSPAYSTKPLDELLYQPKKNLQSILIRKTHWQQSQKEWQSLTDLIFSRFMTPLTLMYNYKTAFIVFLHVYSHFLSVHRSFPSRLKESALKYDLLLCFLCTIHSWIKHGIEIISEVC